MKKWCFRSPESTQLEDPRAQWQREQESMLRDYLSVARDALSAQKEICQVKEQRLLLAQQEYRQLNDAWRDKSTSQTSREFHTLFFFHLSLDIFVVVVIGGAMLDLRLQTTPRPSCSQLQVFLVLQVRPRHSEGRDRHSQEPGEYLHPHTMLLSFRYTFILKFT